MKSSTQVTVPRCELPLPTGCRWRRRCAAGVILIAQFGWLASTSQGQPQGYPVTYTQAPPPAQSTAPSPLPAPTRLPPAGQAISPDAGNFEILPTPNATKVPQRLPAVDDFQNQRPLQAPAAPLQNVPVAPSSPLGDPIPRIPQWDLLERNPNRLDLPPAGPEMPFAPQFPSGPSVSAAPGPLQSNNPPNQPSPSHSPVQPEAPADTSHVKQPVPNPADPLDLFSCPLPQWNDFSPTPMPMGSEFYDPSAQQYVYDAKYDVPTQRPLIEWGIPFYAPGMMPRGGTLFGKTNLLHPAFYMYGDYRIGASTGRNAGGRIDNVAHRLNLDLDLRLTATERFHAFIGPLNQATQFSQFRLEDGSVEYDSFVNLNPVTGFFEGDIGAMLGGLDGTPSPFEMPVALGLVPLLFQNGVWMEDAVTAAAITIPAKHSVLLDWSNFDVTGFAIADQLNSPAFGADNHAAQALGVAAFIDAYDGYIETGYAYLNDRDDLGRSYHNLTASYTRRYFQRINNSLRIIINTGQDLDKSQRTADGGLLLIENSLVTSSPMRIVPYLNLFYGWDRPQSVARAALSGGILRNVGINFDPDGLNDQPTLDASANDTYGGTVGVDLLGADLDRQWILEMAYLGVHGSPTGRIAKGDQIGFATRYQFPISYRTLIRFDAMYGIRRADTDIYGTRMEWRWKF